MREPSSQSASDPSSGEEKAVAAFLQLKRCAMLLIAGLSGLGSPPANAGLTESQFDVLQTLHRRGPLHQHQLLLEQWFSKGNLTLVLKGLERGDLVRRRRLQEDHRFVEVELTDAGRSLISKLLPLQARVVHKFFSVLTVAEQTQFSQTCLELSSHAAKCFPLKARANAVDNTTPAVSELPQTPRADPR